MQSPIGLVPNTGNKTRLIFHLSYNFKNGNKSINYWTPVDMFSMNYNDLNSAVRDCIQLIKHLGIDTIFFTKSDLKSAFRILVILPSQCCYLIMKARDPITKNWFFFVDKCLPFGASISCAHFQPFSNGLKVIIQGISNRVRYTYITNYLDDFLFIYFTSSRCDEIVCLFLQICEEKCFPVSL